MDYAEAMSFVFRDEQWLKKLAIGGLLAFLSFYLGIFFILGFFIVGYYVGIIRNAARGEERALPEWEKLNTIFIDGIMGSVIILVNFLVIGGICAFIIVNVATDVFTPMVPFAHHNAEKAVTIVFVSVVTLFALMILTNLGIMQYSRSNNFADAFNLPAIMKFLRNNFGNFIAIAIFSLILNLVLLVAGLGILSPFTNFWGLVVQAHLFGQCLKEDTNAVAVVNSAQSGPDAVS